MFLFLFSGKTSIPHPEAKQENPVFLGTMLDKKQGMQMILRKKKYCVRKRKEIKKKNKNIFK